MNLMNIYLFPLYLEKFSNKAKKIPFQKQPSKCFINFGKLLKKYPWRRSYFSKVKLLKLLNKEYNTTTLQRTLQIACILSQRVFTLVFANGLLCRHNLL